MSRAEVLMVCVGEEGCGPVGEAVRGLSESECLSSWQQPQHLLGICLILKGG
jgi:hypothetical protein